MESNVHVQCLLVRLSVTSEIIQALCTRLRQGLFNPLIDLMLETVCTVAYFGFLRCGEFTCHRSFDPNVNLCVDNVTVFEDHIALLLRSSKTDPCRKGVSILLFKTRKKLMPVFDC